MVEHWEEFGPPVYIAAALKFGLVDGKKKKGSKATPAVDHSENERNLQALAAELSGSGGVFYG